MSKLVRKWSWSGAGVTSMPAVVEGVVYFGDWKGTLYVGNGWEWLPAGTLMGGLIAYALP